MERCGRQGRRSLLALLLAGTLITAACGSGGSTAATTITKPPASGTPTSPPAPKEIVFKDPAGDCIDASNDQPAKCPTPGIDIRSIKLASGSLRITYTVAAPGLPGLTKQWRAFIDADIDHNKATGSQRLFKINNEVIGSDLDIEAKATGGPMGEARATVTIWDAKGTIVKTFGETDGVTAAWTTDTTLEIVVPDVALLALAGAVRPVSYGGAPAPVPTIGILWMCLEETDSLADWKDCVREEAVDLENAEASTN
jgi:hypothetical protein